MKTESSLVSQKGQEIGKQSKEKKNKKSTKKKKIKKAMPNIVQKLFETCKEVFAKGEAGFVPPPADIERLRSVLDHIKPEDVNLTPNMPYFNGAENEKDPPTITYLQIYECHKFSIGIFCLPSSGTIPLHNHPGMTVFSKLLFGTMHIKSYDWVTDIASSSRNENVNSLRYSQQQPELQLAKVQVDSDFTAPCDASILYPAAGGNMHCFRALTPCAVLDVLGPPYSRSEGRDCTYYHDSPYTTLSELSPEEGMREGSYAWLKERERPENFVLVGEIYGGPIIMGN